MPIMISISFFASPIGSIAFSDRKNIPPRPFSTTSRSKEDAAGRTRSAILLESEKTDLHSHKSPALLMLSENAPAPATFCGSGRIPPQLSADMVLPSDIICNSCTLRFLTREIKPCRKIFLTDGFYRIQPFYFSIFIARRHRTGLDGLPPGIS